MTYSKILPNHIFLSFSHIIPGGKQNRDLGTCQDTQIGGKLGTVRAESPTSLRVYLNCDLGTTNSSRNDTSQAYRFSTLP